MMTGTIAACTQADYSLDMRLRALRGWLALCTVLVLTLGVAAHGFAAADMGARMMTAATAGEMSPSSGGCGGCSGGDDGMLVAGCFALCTATVAVLPGVALVKPVAVEPAAVVPVRSGLGRVASPDPYPPKPSILS